MLITPDLIEWLLADKKVCESWRLLASRLNFACHIGSLDKHGGGDSGSLRLLLRLWSSLKPASYNVRGLKRVLAAEGLHHMWLWISLMTQKDAPPPPQQTTTQSANHSQTLPNRKHTNPSPWSSYLYTLPNSKTSDYSYPSTANSNDIHSPPLAPDYSRPNPFKSDYNTYSCPSSPLINRRNMDTQKHSHTNMSNNTNSQRNMVKRAHSNSSQTSDYSYPSTVSDIHSPPRTTDYSSSTSIQSEHNAYSCPSSPLSHRRNTDTWKKHVDINTSPHRNKVKRSHSHRSADRVPNLAKLTSPRIVETETWKKEVYKKVIEEVNEYNHNQNALKKHKSGSLPNLAEEKYTSCVEIQLGTNTLKGAEKRRKQSEHEKEILQLCDDIIAEMKVKKPERERVIPLHIDLGEEPIYDKIKKDEPIYDKINKDNISDNIVKDKTEIVDNYISVKKVKIVTLSSFEETEIDNSQNIPRNFDNSYNDLPVKKVNNEASKEYFESLVNILEEAVRDISR